MPKNLTRASEVLKKQLQGVGHLSDEHLIGTCAKCGIRAAMAEANIAHEGAETHYRCKNGCGDLLIVGDVEKRAWPGRGYRLGPFVLRTVVDITVVLDLQTGGGILLPGGAGAAGAN
jgi:hypothetical protein